MERRRYFDRINRIEKLQFRDLELMDFGDLIPQFGNSSIPKVRSENSPPLTDLYSTLPKRITTLRRVSA
jgi:hypothetical protein